MANKALKGLTIKIGADTSELTKSLDKVEKQGRSLSSELGQINKLLKLDPKNTELLAQKQKVLADAISNTEDKLDTLKEAEKQVQAQFERGEVSEEQYRALRREIVDTEKKLEQYKNAAKETADAQEELASHSGKVTRKLDDLADEAKKASEATEEMDDTAGELAKGGLAAMATAAAAAVTAIVALAEESREYRNEMAKLDTAFTDNGFSTEAATKTYEELQSVLGETEQAVEAANHLAALAKTEEDLAAWTDIATGVYAKFGASLPIEGLTEAANETAKVGQVTGPLADALNWAGISEDKFNESLEKCTSEQERQRLITKTLTKTYSSAAAQFKKTNKEVIASNKATEKWNKATAKVGKTVEPLITDVKELGATLVEDAGEPLEDIAEYIQDDVLPAIKDVSAWARQNGPVIKGVLVGTATALVTLKAATIAATVAQNGLKGAIMATTVAQKALALAQSATPWGLAATAIAGVTAALVVVAAAMADAQAPADALTKEERELMKAADETAASFRDQKKATDEALADTTAQMGYVQDLANELKGLANASGEVKKSDQERAQFILNELNEALGTEYKMVDGVIQKYSDLKKNIDEVIQSKLANSLIEAANADYVAAIQAEAEALENVNLSEKDYRAQLEKTQAAQKAYQELYALWVEGDLPYYAQEHMNELLEEAEYEEKLLAEKKAEYDKAAVNYGNYYNTIATYEEAQAAALAGNYEKVVDILAKKGGAYGTYSEKVDTETAKVLDTLYKEAIDAGLEAERTKKNFEDGVNGYTKKMVKEAETNYQKALKEFETAYADAEGVGEDVGEGFSGGMEKKRSSLLEKARSLVTGVIAAMRKEADSHSPARKTIDFGEDVGEGAEIGIERKTKDVKKAATRQVSAVLDAYRAEEVNAQTALRNVAEQQTERQANGQKTAAASYGPMLERILTAIEHGQVLTIDGDALVGATANSMDSALGRRRALAARGAL